MSIAAPGENIYSTTPVSYPFYANYYNNVPSGYAYTSGTSAAAAFVSGAAARTVTTLTGADAPAPKGIKDRLIAGGDPLQFAVDVAAADGAEGFNNTFRLIDGVERAYGTPFVLDPYDPELEIVMAPFCWPTVDGSFGAAQDMSNATYLNVARSMKRGALIAEVKDAFSGTPTTGANVSAAASGVTYDIAVTSGSPFVVMINLPEGGKGYDLSVSKSGATNKYQKFNQGVAIEAGRPIFDAYSTVSLPSITNTHVVLDWLNPRVGPDGGPQATVDLDLYMAAPSDSGCAADSTCMIGTEGMYDETTHKYEKVPYLVANWFGMGTLLSPDWYDGSWSPYAIHNFDGISETTEQEPIIAAPTESITLKYGRVSKKSPYLFPYYTGGYKFYVTDNSFNEDWHTAGVGPGYLDNDPTSDFFVAPVVRYWAKGYIIATVRLADSNSTCDGSNEWWRPFNLNGSSGIPNTVNTCTDTLVP